MAGGRGRDFITADSPDYTGADQDDDVLNGGQGGDTYAHGWADGWDNDTIVDTAIPDEDVDTGNTLEFRYDYDARIGADNLTINLNSDSGPVPELTNGTDATNWSGNVIDNVYNLAYGTDDQIVGNDAANSIHSTSGSVDYESGADADTISAGGGNDRISVRGDDGTDRVDCGAGTDTVFFDVGEDVLVVPAECENKNPPLR